jgi:GNAT superfamily N-acetyltransferase
MQTPHGNYLFDDSPARIDFPKVHAWLAATYWSPGTTRQRVEKAAAGSSLVVGCYLGDTQVSYCRVISDRATFAWLCDVIVDEAHRGQGIGHAMVAFALAHPDHQNLPRWLLATKDAHGVYADLGFKPLPSPERWMARMS